MYGTSAGCSAASIDVAGHGRDRRRRQAAVPVGVVRRVAVVVRVGDRTLAAPARVQERRVDLERHVVAQPVLDHRRDQRPVLVELRLGLDQRRDDHACGTGRPTSSSPAFVACSSKCVDERLQQRLLGVGLAHVVRVGPGEPFERRDVRGLELASGPCSTARPRGTARGSGRDLADPVRDHVERQARDQRELAVRRARPAARAVGGGARRPCPRAARRCRPGTARRRRRARRAGTRAPSRSTSLLARARRRSATRPSPSLRPRPRPARPGRPAGRSGTRTSRPRRAAGRGPRASRITMTSHAGAGAVARPRRRTRDGGRPGRARRASVPVVTAAPPGTTAASPRPRPCRRPACARRAASRPRPGSARAMTVVKRSS